MRKWFVLFLGLLIAAAFTFESADAHGRHHRKVGKGVKVAAVVTGAAATATYFGINHWRWKWDGSNTIMPQGAAWGATTIACMAVAPMLASALEGRELSLREAHVLFAGCLIPIVGGYLENKLWDANPQWNKFEKPQFRHRHHRHAKK